MILQDAVYYDFDHFIKFLEKSSSQKLFDINSINIQYVNKNKYKMLEVNKFFSLEYENIFNLIRKINILMKNLKLTVFYYVMITLVKS